MKDLELLEEVVVCGKCGTESDSFWCVKCWDVMICWTTSPPLPVFRCIYCEYPEPPYMINPSKYCTGCGIKYGVELIPAPKPKLRRRRNTAPSHDGTTAPYNIPFNGSATTTGPINVRLYWDTATAASS